MIEITEETIEQLARRFSPVLSFHPEERFFPLLVESWLTHTSEGIWPEATEQEVRLRTAEADLHRRGAALLTADRHMTGLSVLAGPPIDGSRPLSLVADASDPYSLMARSVAEAGAEAFLTVGGWRTEDGFDDGDLDHLASLCSELAAAMTPKVAWNPAEDRPTHPWPWVAQPAHPTMYCEVGWAGAHSRVAGDHGLGEFPADDPSLDGMVRFTYYLFYAAREAPTSPGARHSEGQWEAISLFFDADPKGVAEDGWLLAGGAIEETPRYVVVSQGQDRSIGGRFTAMEDYRLCELSGDHPVIYVAKGTHRNYYEPVDGQTVDPTANPPHGPDTTAYDDSDDTWDGVDAFLVIAAVLLAIAALIVAILLALGLVVAAVIVAILAVIAALVLFIMWICSACTEASDRDAGEDVSHAPEQDEASSDGPVAGGDGSEEPSGAGPGSGGSTPGGAPAGAGGGTVGLPNTGSPTGRSTVFADVRIVDRLFVGGASDRHTTFPTDRVMENPSWWDYRGRWGARVRHRPAAGEWESGWIRVDDTERDWGYFTAERVLIALNGGPRQSF